MLRILRRGFNAIGVPPPVHLVVTGTILLVIAIVDAPDLFKQITRWRFARSEYRRDLDAGRNAGR